MKITIVSDSEYLCISPTPPKIGHTYELEDAATGTQAQNKAFHALVSEYFVSGCFSYQANTLDDFRNCIKRSLGAGFEAYVYATVEGGHAVIHDAKRWDDVPQAIREDPERAQFVRGRLKSWSAYTKRQRMDTLDKLIAEMRQTGVNSRHFAEIIEGMEKA